MLKKLNKIKVTNNHVGHFYGIASILLGIIGLGIAPSQIFVIIAIAILVLGIYLVVIDILHPEKVEPEKVEPIANDLPNNLLRADDLFLYEQFEKFNQAQALILLAPAHRINPLILGNIEQLLQEQFGQENTYHLVPVAGSEVEPAIYFSHLAQQINLTETVTNSAELERILDWKLNNREHLCLLISSLEKGDGKRANELASSLRNLLEHHKLYLHLLFCGGKKLAELRFANGDLSLLNCAAVGYWRELTGPDVQQLYQQAFPEQPPLSAEPAKALLEVSGGHPKLLEHCFAYWVNNDPIEKYSQQLQQEDVLVAVFTPFLNKPDFLRQILGRLASLDICPATTYIFDDLLRQLYWANLLVKRKMRLVWRCEAIRQAGISILNI